MSEWTPHVRFAEAPPPVRTTALADEVATVERDIFHPAFDGVMRPDDDTLLTRGGGQGLKIYDQIERDGHAYAVLQKRKMAVIAREYVVEPASEDPRDVAAADMVRRQLGGAKFDQMCLDLLDALLKGFAVGECIWRPGPVEVELAQLKPKEQRRFVFDTEGRLRLLTHEHMYKGIELPERKFVVHQFGSKNGNPYGLGLGHKLFWPVWFKKQGITFWLTFADKFGSPTAVGEYPPGTTPEDQRKLLGALQAISREAGVTVPQGMVIKLLEAARSGSVDTYEKLVRYMDEQISECVLGETLTTNIGSSGSRAASQTHNEVREELIKADADLLSITLNEGPVQWLVDYNMPGARPPQVWRVFPEDAMALEEKRKKRAETDKIIFGMGFRPTPEYVRETYGEGWVPTPAPAAPTSQGPEFAEPEPGVVDQFSERANGLAADAMEELLSPVRQLVENASSLEEIRDGLIDLYPDLPAASFQELVREALAAASLAGRFEVADGR